MRSTPWHRTPTTSRLTPPCTDALTRSCPTKTTPLNDRVRIAGAIGVFAGVLGFSGKAFRNVPIDELQPLLVAAVNDVLQVD